MKVYRIWNETRQVWITTNKTIWVSERNAKIAVANLKSRWYYSEDVFKIFEYELIREKEIV
jgi:hypothetical protein